MESLPRIPFKGVLRKVCREGPAAGMMVVFGGRTAENKSLKECSKALTQAIPNGTSIQDTWGLRQHRDGRWDWVEADIKSQLKNLGVQNAPP